MRPVGGLGNSSIPSSGGLYGGRPASLLAAATEGEANRRRSSSSSSPWCCCSGCCCCAGCENTDPGPAVIPAVGLPGSASGPRAGNENGGEGNDETGGLVWGGAAPVAEGAVARVARWNAPWVLGGSLAGEGGWPAWVLVGSLAGGGAGPAGGGCLPAWYTAACWLAEGRSLACGGGAAGGGNAAVLAAAIVR